jgi:hypothetical protein
MFECTAATREAAMGLQVILCLTGYPALVVCPQISADALACCLLLLQPGKEGEHPCLYNGFVFGSCACLMQGGEVCALALGLRSAAGIWEYGRLN